MFRPAKASTKNGAAVGEVPEEGRQVWALTKDGVAVAGKFVAHRKIGGANLPAFVSGPYLGTEWGTIAMWVPVPALGRDEQGRVVMKDLPF